MNPKIKEILSFFSIEAIPQEFREAFELFAKAFKEKRVSGRELISTTHPKHFYLEQVMKLPNYETRTMAREQKLFTDNIIYGNKMAIFSFKRRFALVIEDEDVVGSFRSLFESAWQSGRRL